MTKFYNQDIPDEINVVYGYRYSGKIYNKFKKIIDILDDLADDYDRDITLDEINLIKNYITKLKEENKKLRKLNVCLSVGNNINYKRINKTIEYIEKLFILEDDNVTYEFKNDEIKPLLKILKGEKND